MTADEASDAPAELAATSATSADPVVDIGDEVPSAPVVVPSSSPVSVARHSEKPVIPQTTSDESSVGWGDDPADHSDDWYFEQRPPHHG